MAQEKFVVAVKKNAFGGNCKQGTILGSYRKKGSAQHALKSLAEQNRLGTSQVGIFQKGRYLKPD